MKRKRTHRPPDGPPRAVIYCRVSTKEQTQNFSLATQRKACEEYCAREGLDVAEVFMEEGESAKTLARTQLGELIEYSERHRRTVQCVVVYRLDRISRNSDDYSALRVLFGKFGIVVRSVTEPITDDPTGRFLENVIAATAQYDNEVRAQRTVAGMRTALNDGRWTFVEPLGYRRALDAGGRVSIEADPIMGPLVASAFALYAKGTETKASVLRTVTAMGLRTRQGRRLTIQTFEKMLRNHLYAGIISVPSLGVERVVGTFEPIVPEELFDAVQAVLDGRRVAVTPHVRNNPDFPLRVWVRCGACGTPLTGSWSRGRSRRYAYYRCRRRDCLDVKMGKGPFESEFLDYLAALRPRREYVRLFRAIVLDAWEGRQAEANNVSASLARRIDELEEQQRKLVNAHVYQQSISADVYRREETRLRQEIADVRSEQLAVQIDNVDVEGVLDFAERLIVDGRRMWESASPEQRQRFQKALFPAGLTYSSQNGFGTAETPWFFQWLTAVQSRKSDEASPTGFEPGYR